MKLRNLYENGILRDDDDYVIKISNEKVVDCREEIDPRYEDYFDYNVKKLHARKAHGLSYLEIRIEKDGEEE